MRGYTQLTRDERYQIYALRKAGHSQKEIAEVLRRNPSTISRELRRNKGLKGYRPEQAHRLAQNRKKERDRTRIPESTWARVEQLLREDWSPEQISGWLTREEGVSVSHERIYQHVYEDKRRGGDLHRHLRCQKPRRKRYGHYDRRGQIRERVSIDERPEVVKVRIPLKMTADSEERDRLAHRFLTGAGFLLRAVTIGQLGGQFAHRFPAQFEAVRTVQQSVEDGVRQGRLADVVVPVLGG